MTLLRALHAELLKIKRTIALKMVVIAPGIFVLLILFVGWQTPFSFLRRQGFDNAWLVLANRHLTVWALLMLPLYVTLQTALMAGLDHSENQWKSLLARPVPRWTLYVAKLIVVLALTAGATVVLLCGVLIDGTILSRVQSEVVFTFPVPWRPILLEGAEVTGLMFLALAIQHWVSFAMEIIFGCFRHRYDRHGDGFCGPCGGRTVWRLAALLSICSSHAGGNETAP